MDSTPPLRTTAYTIITFASLLILGLCIYVVDQYSLYSAHSRTAAQSLSETAPTLVEIANGLPTLSDRHTAVTSSAAKRQLRDLLAQAISKSQNIEASLSDSAGLPLIAYSHNSPPVQHAISQSALEHFSRSSTPITSSTFSLLRWGAPTFIRQETIELSGYPAMVLSQSIKPVLPGTLLYTAVAKISLISFLITMVIYGISVLIGWRHVNERWKTNHTIRFLAHNDPLTHLPNRAVFSDHLSATLKRASKNLRNVFVIAIDVDKFKQINDTYGHGVGDVFLQVIADRLRMVFGEHLASRISGDEFAAIIDADVTPKEVSGYAERLLAASSTPCVIEGKELEISLSLGVASARDSLWRPSKLLHCADLALYRSKQAGRATYTWYHASMDAELQERRDLEQEMRSALQNNGFQVMYQPQVSLVDNRLKAFEALLRWEHPKRGAISPQVFIPIAEESGMIEDLGEYVLRKACEDAASWSDPTISVAVNFSPAQFKSGQIERQIASALRNAKLPPRRLEIEITEGLLISDTESVLKSLRTIGRMGVSIAMDDFGTGYSSLSYLSKFPFNKIKIDRSFVQKIGEDSHTDAIITAIIGMGRSLNVQITAEGVEQERQAKILRAGGCHLVQGFYFGRPRYVNPAAPHEGIRCKKAKERQQIAVQD
ncbi:putative bifunctional diguanylate cyclase/phosphodiesterase [Polycladidibacter hongkongensis]|uniref:putative bifunctional diguanylate cyclase/phosphodiesterase n=1 Tax=Polycladidibacter hongkongensis TaxID=1647556 RepID=UPI000B2BF948|nr:bifunctional diguanylate cyclase/phosphodiesterase [Pseudovibrio hongkongensis]